MCEADNLEGVFGRHAAYVNYSELFDMFVQKYELEFQSEETRECAIVLARYYSSQPLPLPGMLRWMKQDFDLFTRTGECRPYRIWKQAQMPVEERRQTSARVTHGPDWRGPEGKWSLD